ncbi:MAG TPA: TetR/AcrR family transcriptional regulator [Terriglobia bacterium]|nr:TetR/AcrR family transcriptional regulator [Terriglobia bacterium]
MATHTHPHTLVSRQPRGVETRAAILEAAEHIFAEVGLAGARTDAIASAAGVNKALLYYYFNSKDALYRAVLEAHLEQFRARAQEAFGAKGSARSRLLAFISVYFDFIAAHPHYPRLMQRLVMADERQVRRFAREYFLPLFQRLVKVIDAGISSGELRPVDSRDAAFSLVGMTVYYFAAAPIVRMVSEGDPHGAASLKRRRREVLDFIRYGLFREPEAPLS